MVIPMNGSLSVRWLNRTDVEIFGYNSPVTPSVWRAVRRELQSWKVNRVLAVRYRDGERVEKWIKVSFTL